MIVHTINGDRAAIGAPPLAISWTLRYGTTGCKGAASHAWAMAQTHAIWHTNPSYPAQSFPNDICVATGWKAQNVGYDFGSKYQALISDYRRMMQEPHDNLTCQTTVNHACNFLSKSAKLIGIGFAQGTFYGYGGWGIVYDLA